jgi:hypothetical protein
MMTSLATDGKKRPGGGRTAKRPRMGALFAAALAVAALAAPLAPLASAQVQPGKPSGTRSAPDPLVGDWQLATSEFEGDCKIKGTMTFRATSIPGTYTCSFETEQICGKLNLNMYIRVTQSCTAQKVGRQVAIKSAVKRIEEARLDGVPGWQSGYLADNFIVTLQPGFSEMLGDHYDEARELKARFWRDNELVS